MSRKSGVLMHVSSLFGDYSSGSFGKGAKYFIDFLSDCGFSYWQVLPFCMVDEYNSPYKSYSSFSGNLYFIDLEDLHSQGLITDEELASARQNDPYLCEFDRLREERFALLSKASARVENRSPIEAYIDASPYLKAFCEFMAHKAANGDAPWQEWQNDSIDESILFAWKFIQYTFVREWQEIKSYANSKGISLIGDIPIYVALDSADVWSAKEQFQLDKKGMPTHVAGVSPDYFSADGQLWGNPLYNWKEMKKDGYKWWCDRIKYMSTLFDAVRIDHFRAFASYWSIPAESKTAVAGKWIKGPGLPFVKALKQAAGETEIIAEDLGDITPDVYKLLVDSRLPGMKVFQFGFLSDDNSAHLPHNYPENSVAYSGTHDNNTLLAYLWELDDETRARMLAYCGHTGDWKSGLDSIIRTIFASHAGLVMLPIQDLLGYGCDTRLNTPGKAGGNWAYRITKPQLDSIDRNKWRALNRLYYR